jgi:hypothetical protein
MNEDGLTIDMSGKALRLKVLFIQYTLWPGKFHEHKIMYLKMDLFNEKQKEKSVCAGM